MPDAVESPKFPYLQKAEATKATLKVDDGRKVVLENLRLCFKVQASHGIALQVDKKDTYFLLPGLHGCEDKKFKTAEDVNHDLLETIEGHYVRLNLKTHRAEVIRDTGPQNSSLQGDELQVDFHGTFTWFDRVTKLLGKAGSDEHELQLANAYFQCGIGRIAKEDTVRKWIVKSAGSQNARRLIHMILPSQPPHVPAQWILHLDLFNKLYRRCHSRQIRRPIQTESRTYKGKSKSVDAGRENLCPNCLQHCLHRSPDEYGPSTPSGCTVFENACGSQ